MKFFTNLTDFLLKIISLVVLLSIIIGLALVIRWKIDTLYMENIAGDEIEFTLLDEIEKTKLDIELYLNGDEPKSTPQIEIIKDKEEDLVSITIPEGASIDDIANELLNKKLMTSIPDFKALVDSMGLTDKFVCGTYQIPKDNKIKNTILTITNSTIKNYEITISEGAAADAVGAKLEKIGAIQSAKAFEEQCKDLNCFYKFKPGTYTIETPSKVIKIIEMLTGENF